MILKSLGLPLAEEKIQLPAQSVKYLGVWINVWDRQVTIPKEKIDNFLQLVDWCLQRQSISKKVTQMIVDKVIHISSCFRAARTFINHILQALRDAHGQEYVYVGQVFRQDLASFKKFLKKFNGISMMKPSDPEFVIDADACPVGGGATDYHSYIAYQFPDNCTRLNISVLEALNCLVACRALITKEKHSKTIKIWCDNNATIESFARGAPRDRYLAGIARALWYCLARANIMPIYEHVASINMVVPDTLSRCLSLMDTMIWLYLSSLNITFVKSRFKDINLISTIFSEFTGKSQLYTAVASTWIRQAFRPATQRHQEYVVRLHVGRAERLAMSFRHPCPELAAAFIVFLAHNFKTQKSVKSLLSTLTALLDRIGVSTTSFRSTHAAMLTRSISSNKRAPTRQRPPIDVPILRQVIALWSATHEVNLPYIAAVLFIFTTGVRQSNLFPPTQRQFDPTRHLTWADITWRSEYIKVELY